MAPLSLVFHLLFRLRAVLIRRRFMPARPTAPTFIAGCLENGLIGAKAELGTHGSVIRKAERRARTPGRSFHALDSDRSTLRFVISAFTMSSFDSRRVRATLSFRVFNNV